MAPPPVTEAEISAELLLETMAEGVVFTDAAGHIRHWNAAMSAMTGYAREDAIGRPVSWLRSPGCQSGAAVAALLAGKTAAGACVTGCECRLQGRDGAAVPVLVNARLVRGRHGRRLGVLQTFTDCRQVEALRGRVQALEAELHPGADFCGLVGRNPRLREACRLLELAAAGEATVLLLGESGTGKELAAVAVHRRSPRQAGPFIRVNCGALSETVLESELFGHARGAFTGAYQDRVGRFEAADGGTIFLDEIGEISPALQVKLLRVLQEREFERVGEVRTRRTNVRVVAATNRDLAAEVRAGRFREDLYYRLKVFPVLLPPLRERLEDIPLLSAHFIARLRQRTGRDIAGLAPAALRAFMQYRWPGNVRELENALEFAFITCQGKELTLSDLPLELREPAPAAMPAAPLPGGTAAPPPPPARQGRPSREARAVLHSPAALRELLASCDWSKAEAARRLGASPTAVWKWLRQHGIPLQPEDTGGKQSSSRKN